jgi:hypothetical protein
LKKLALLSFLIFCGLISYAQFENPRGTNPVRTSPRPNQSNNPGSGDIDSLRKDIDSKKDSVIYNATYIKYTKEEFLRDSTKLLPLDTSAVDFQRYRILDQPEHPSINLGLNGLAYRDMLFEPAKTIGFDAGYHYYDRYLIKPKDVKYYRARSPYTNLFYMTPAFGRLTEQMFLAEHSQNIKPNWNIGASYAKKGSRAYYGAPGQRADALVANHLNAAIWTWYESKNQRYNLLANGTFNTLKGLDNGSILNDSIFRVATNVAPEFEQSRLSTAKHDWRNNTLYIKQFYNIGKQKLVDSASAVLPTQRVSYSLSYQTQKFTFKNDGFDQTGLLKNYFQDSTKTSDSTAISHLQNEFNYNFYLRGKSVSFLRNELKVNVGIRHDYYHFNQLTTDLKFQNVSLLGTADYGFSDKASLNINLTQIIQGRNFGDFLYQAQSEIKLGNKIGSVILEAYSQNQSPALIYEMQISNHYRWDLNFQKTKTQNLAFSYVIPKYNFKVKAEYFLRSNHLYFDADISGDAIPAQFGTNINLFKFTLKKNFKFRKFSFDNFIVYQKTDFENILRTPEIYSFHSFYFTNIFFKVLKASFGFDVTYFGKYTAPSYAVGIGQFYNKENVKFDAAPIVDVWARTNWKRANLFLRYDYANKGLFNSGYYTVNQYPMPYSLAKFGVSWRFYD